MSVESEIINEQVSKLTSAYEMLKAVMPDYFFKTFANGIGKILPLLCNLEKQSGIRRAELNNEVFFVYILTEENNPTVTSRTMSGMHLLSATIHQSIKPLIINNEPMTLMIEHYVIENGVVGEQLVSLADLQKEYTKQFGQDDIELVKEAYGRLNFSAIADLDASRLAQRLHWVLMAQGEDNVMTGVEDWNSEELRLTVSMSIPIGTCDFGAQLLEIIYSSGLQPQRCYFREMTRNSDITDFAHMPVIVATVYMNAKPGEKITQDLLEKLMADIRLIDWVEMGDVLHKELVWRHNFSLAATHWIRSAAEFIHGQLSFIDRNAYKLTEITRYLAVYSDLSLSLYNLFEKIHNSALPRPSADDVNAERQAILDEISRINSGNHDKDTLVKNIFKSVLNFLDCIKKTNFFCKEKSALAYRLSPDFTHYYRDMGEQYTKSFPSDLPFGVFFMYRRKAFGYQIRFSEIGRGGWRTVIPGRGANVLEMYDNYDVARDEAYREVFVLANTQHLKNKDIYEGGSKMFTLMEPLVDPSLLKNTLWQNQRAFTRAFISLVNYDEDKKLKDKSIVDLLGMREIVEIGPDENMFDTMIEWMGNYAKEVGYTLGSGIISGKPGAGINHKHYGVTSFGVLQYLLKTLSELGIDPTKDDFSLKIAGGPGGDVAGNAMKLLLADGPDGKPLYPKLRIIAVTDGPAAAYDPDGLDRNELKRLVLTSNLDSFNPKKLHGDGATIFFSKPIIEDGHEMHRQVIAKKNGKSVEYTEKMIDRDEFMLLFQGNLVHYADVFVPAGGRPSTINEANWQDFFPAGKPAFRAIVEGANSYITPAARKLIQQNGVWIVKDASANKCGVITSSYEIISGIMLEEEEFKEVKSELVAEVMTILKHRAVQEANWLYANFRSSGTPMTELTEHLSRKINAENVQINAFLSEHPEYVTDELLLSHLPPMFRTAKYAGRLARLPEEYRRAVASVELACRLVYSDDELSLGSRLLALMNDKEKKGLSN